jgi:hypothetical protein
MQKPIFTAATCYAARFYPEGAGKAGFSGGNHFGLKAFLLRQYKKGWQDVLRLPSFFI